MMGEKTLREIKTELRDAFARKGIDVETWLDQQMAKLNRGPRSDPSMAATLGQVQRALRMALDEKKNKPRRSKKSNGKKKPAA